MLVTMVTPASARPELARETANGGGAAGYRRVQMVEMRAAATRYDDDDKTRRALQRLGQVLESGQRPRQDVPQGYYLDILV